MTVDSRNRIGMGTPSLSSFLETHGRHKAVGIVLVGSAWSREFNLSLFENYRCWLSPLWCNTQEIAFTCARMLQQSCQSCRDLWLPRRFEATGVPYLPT